MPPTDDCMKNWDTSQKLEVHKAEYFDKRRREVKEKEELGIEIPLRKRAEERPSQYRDEKTGLPNAYGKYAPFKFYPNPPNLRHYKNLKKSLPDIKEVRENKEKVVEI
jgi:hypothetical protein